MSKSGTIAVLPTNKALASLPHLIEKHGRELALDMHGRPLMSIGTFGTLIPRSDLALLVEGLTAAMKPASPEYLEKILAMIACAWPHAHQKVADEVSAGFSQQLAEELTNYPPDVLHQTVVRARQTIKFMPSIAEFIEIAQSFHRERSGRLRIAHAHLAEHDRRDELAREEAERAAADRRCRCEEYKRLQEAYGAVEFPDDGLEDFVSHGSRDIVLLRSIFHWGEVKARITAADPAVLPAIKFALAFGRLRRANETMANFEILKAARAELSRFQIDEAMLPKAPDDIFLSAGDMERHAEIVFAALVGLPPKEQPCAWPTA